MVATEASALGQRIVPVHFQQDFWKGSRCSEGDGLHRSQHPEIVGQTAYEVRGEEFPGTGESRGRKGQTTLRRTRKDHFRGTFLVGLVFLPPPSLVKARNPS